MWSGFIATGETQTKEGVSVKWCLLTHSLTHTLTHSLTPHSTVLLQKLTSLCSQSRNSPHFMEPESSLPHSQVPATGFYPKPAQSSP
jgi:hypothetical protein